MVAEGVRKQDLSFCCLQETNLTMVIDATIEQKDGKRHSMRMEPRNKKSQLFTI